MLVLEPILVGQFSAQLLSIITLIVDRLLTAPVLVVGQAYGGRGMKYGKPSSAVIASDHCGLVNSLEERQRHHSVGHRRPNIQTGRGKGSRCGVSRQRVLGPGPEHGIACLAETGQVVQGPSTRSLAREHRRGGQGQADHSRHRASQHKHRPPTAAEPSITRPCHE